MNQIKSTTQAVQVGGGTTSLPIAALRHLRPNRREAFTATPQGNITLFPPPPSSPPPSHYDQLK